MTSSPSCRASRLLVRGGGISKVWESCLPARLRTVTARNDWAEKKNESSRMMKNSSIFFFVCRLWFRLNADTEKSLKLKPSQRITCHDSNIKDASPCSQEPPVLILWVESFFFKPKLLRTLFAFYLLFLTSIEAHKITCRTFDYQP